MKLAFKKTIGYTNIGLGFLCALSWLLNTLGAIHLGDPDGQLIMVPVCFALGAMLLKEA
jgi:hypothetical protein